MTSIGINGDTGMVITGWDRTKQSITEILITEIGSRVQRRGLGAGTTSKIDQPENLEKVMSIYIDVAEAIEPRTVDGVNYGEPCFALNRVTAGFPTPGHVVIYLEGIEYPNGHLGDFTKGTSRSINLEL